MMMWILMVATLIMIDVESTTLTTAESLQHVKNQYYNYSTTTTTYFLGEVSRMKKHPDVIGSECHDRTMY